MKKKIFLVMFTLLMAMTGYASQSMNGIVVYAEGQQTCYLFSEMPAVTYLNSEGIVQAAIFVKGKDVPVVVLPLVDENKLVVEYGEVEEVDEIKEVTSKVDKNRKFIQCGRIVIEKDGKLYNTDGTRVK